MILLANVLSTAPGDESLVWKQRMLYPYLSRTQDCRKEYWQMFLVPRLVMSLWFGSNKEQRNTIAGECCILTSLSQDCRKESGKCSQYRAL